jgi:hypothetical protein
VSVSTAALARAQEAAAAATAPAAAAAATPASAAPAEDAAALTKYELGVRIGFSFPVGAVSDLVAGAMPIWVDGGYRISPRLLVGGYASFALAFTQPGCLASCTGYVIDVGAEARYHTDPFLGLDPWFGAGLGFTDLSAYGTSFSGPEVNVQGGLDYKPGFGPFVGFAFDDYSGGSGEWITLGVRGTYDW